MSRSLPTPPPGTRQRSGQYLWDKRVVVTPSNSLILQRLAQCRVLLPPALVAFSFPFLHWPLPTKVGTHADPHEGTEAAPGPPASSSHDLNVESQLS